MDEAEQNSPNADAVTIQSLRRVMAVFTALLVGVTWPLWIPGGDFPRVPWLALAERWPAELDWLWLAALAALLTAQFIPLSSNRRMSGRLQTALLIGSLMLLPTDQHRLQPWAWQMTVMAVVIGLSTNARVTCNCLRWLTVSVYFWSAISKLDWAFLEGRGQWLLEGLSRSVGLTSDIWPEQTRLILVAGFPLAELLVAIALIWPRMQRVGLFGAILMHGLLLMTLGPWGQQQLPAVLLWNVYFIIQNVLLFGRRPNDSSGDAPVERREWLARGVTMVVCLLPALSPWGYWDHWPSWAVYSERSAIVHVAVTSEDVPHLPHSLQPFVGPAEPLSDWRPVNLDAWSFATCRCPMYPQQRYRLAVISSLSVNLPSQPRILIYGPPNRWTGEREREERTSFNAVDDGTPSNH